MDRGRTLGTTCERQSWGLSNNSGIRTVNWESQSKDPPQSPEDERIYCILLIRITFCNLSKNSSPHCLFYVTMNIYFLFYFNIARDLVRGLLLLVDIYHYAYTFAHAYIQAHTYTSTRVCIPTTRHRSLIGRDERRFVFVGHKGFAHTHTT